MSICLLIESQMERVSEQLQMKRLQEEANDLPQRTLPHHVHGEDFPLCR